MSRFDDVLAGQNVLGVKLKNAIEKSFTADFFFRGPRDDKNMTQIWGLKID